MREELEMMLLSIKHQQRNLRALRSKIYQFLVISLGFLFFWFLYAAAVAA